MYAPMNEITYKYSKPVTRIIGTTSTPVLGLVLEEDVADGDGIVDGERVVLGTISFLQKGAMNENRTSVNGMGRIWAQNKTI